MSTRRRWLRFGVGAIAAVAFAGGWAGAPISVHAFSSVTVNHGQCHNLDPFVTQNALTAVRSDDRPWAQISSFTVAGGVGAATITLNLCGGLPAGGFPDPVNGDPGIQWEVCFKDDNSAFMKDDNGVFIGHDPVTGDLFDGPYPGDDGYRVCAWAAVNAGVPGVTSGVAIYDLVDQFHTEAFDQPQLGGSFKAATVVASTVTMTFPYTWTVTKGDGLGNVVTTNRPVVAAGDTLSAVTASSEIGIGPYNLPFPICVPGPMPNCGILGPIQSTPGYSIPLDFAPGYVWCDSLGFVGGHPIPNPAACHKTGDAGDAFSAGFDLGLAPPDWPLAAVVSPVDPADSVGTVDVALRAPLSANGGILPFAGYDFVYGRVFPGTLPVPVDGNLYTGTAQYLDGGDSLVA